MSRYLTRALPGLALAGALLLSACGDDDGGSATLAPTQAPATTPASTAHLDPQVVGSLQGLATRWGQASAKITYDFATTTAGQSTQASVVYYAAPPSSRVDFLEQGENSFIVITRPDIGYFCAVAGGTAQCAASPASAEDSAADAVPFLGDFADPEGLNRVLGTASTLAEVGGEEIAGQPARCFGGGVSFPDDTGEARWCFSAEGLMLLASFNGTTMGFNLRATEIDATMATDFDPPYEVVEVATP